MNAAPRPTLQAQTGQRLRGPMTLADWETTTLAFSLPSFTLPISLCCQGRLPKATICTQDRVSGSVFQGEFYSLKMSFRSATFCLFISLSLSLSSVNVPLSSLLPILFFEIPQACLEFQTDFSPSKMT